MELRPYQQSAVAGICSQLQKSRSTVAVLATGLGKTVIFAKAIELALRNRERRAIVLAHREELIVQASRKIHQVTGLEAVIEMADRRSMEDGFHRPPVIVSSIQTQNSGRGDWRRMKRFDVSHPWFVVVDECHHAVSSSYRGVIDHYMSHPQSRLLGVTATPDRLDSKALGQVFESVAYRYDVADGIRDGWLCPIKQRFVECDSLDFSHVASVAGDLKLNELEEALERSLQEMVVPMVRVVGDRRTLVFAATVKHAERITEILNRPSLQTGGAEMVHGGTPRESRAEIFERFGAGRIQYLVNVAVATEGWDDPAMDGRGVQVIAMMRPTKSRSLYCQMLGRGTRTLPGVVDGIKDAQERREAIALSAKDHVLVLDFLGNAGRHQLVYAGDVLGGDMDPATVRRYNAAKKKMAVDGEIDVLEMLDQEEEKRKAEMEARRRVHVVGRARFSVTDVDPFEALGITAKTPPRWATRIPATEKQRAMLSRNGLRVTADLDMVRAKQLIDALMSRCTDKQAHLIRRSGIDPSRLDRKSASEVIDLIKRGMTEDANRIASRLDGAEQPS